MDTPRLSVIVAAHDARGSIRDCLASLTAQLGPGDELIVVDNSADGTTDVVRRDFPAVRCLTLPRHALVNELWSAGIRQCRGAIVALTTAHCVPAPDWVRAVVDAPWESGAGFGGAIDGEPASGLVDWAVCFCRYSRFLPPMAARAVTDIPADNAAYRREPLFRHEAVWRDGFWEPPLHRALLAEGEQLRLAPAMLVRHRHSFGFAAFLRERYRHGRQYGGWRRGTLSPARRALYLLASPLIVPLQLWRTVRRVLGKGGRAGRLVASLPLLAAFYTAWAWGEALGYARGAAR